MHPPRRRPGARGRARHPATWGFGGSGAPRGSSRARRPVHNRPDLRAAAVFRRSGGRGAGVPEARGRVAMGGTAGRVLVDGGAGRGHAARRRAGCAGCGRRAGLARPGAGDGAPVQSRACRGGARGVADGAEKTARGTGPGGYLSVLAGRRGRGGVRARRKEGIASAADPIGSYLSPTMRKQGRAAERPAVLAGRRGRPSEPAEPATASGQHKKGRPHQRPPLPRLIGGRPGRRPPIAYSSSSSLRRRMASSRMRRAPRLARAMQLSRSMLSPVCGSIFQRPSRSSHTSL